MDDQLKSRLVSYLDTLDAKLKAGSDFVASETPLLVQEWLAWMFWENLILSILCLLAIIILAVLTRKAWMWSGQIKDEETTFFCRAMILVGAMAMCGLSVAGAVRYSMTTLKVSISPRVVVVEKVAELTGVGKK